MHRLCCPQRRSLPSSLRSIHLKRCFLTTAHRLSDKPNLPNPSPQNGDQPHHAYEQNFARQTLYSIDFFRRLIKFTLVGLFAVGATSAVAYQATHNWVERVSLVPHQCNPEDEYWGWVEEAERWSGGSAGGTEPALGSSARRAVRSAWMALHWGTGKPTPTATRTTSQSGVHAFDANLEYAYGFLSAAIASTDSLDPTTFTNPHAVTELRARRAAVLERIGSTHALLGAKSDYQAVWEDTPESSLIAARIALKLGDVSSWLNARKDALEWWSSSLRLLGGEINIEESEESNKQKSKGSADAPSISIPAELPGLPFNQRTLAALLTSLSAFYSQTGRLQNALHIQQTGLALLNQSLQLDSKNLSPSKQLHQLYISHRSSLLSVHMAEVTYALTSDRGNSISMLRQAAEFSEKVAFALSGLPFLHPDAHSPSTLTENGSDPLSPNAIPHPPAANVNLSKIYEDLELLKAPATGLLRTARRTAAEAWNLAGLLYEGQGGPDASKLALDCFERALGWAGADPTNGKMLTVATQPSSTSPSQQSLISDSMQTALWSNYVRARDVVRSVGKDGS